MPATRYTATLTAVGLCLIAGGFPGVAKEPDVDPYEPCSQITDNASRLQCFDATFARERVARVERRQEDVKRTIDDFGLTGAQIDERANERSAARVAALPPVVAAPGATPGTAPAASALPALDADPDSINVTIDEVFTDQRGNYVMLLSNGQVWRANAAKNYRGSVRAGWKARIYKGKIGGFRIEFDGKTGFLGVDRVR